MDDVAAPVAGDVRPPVPIRRAGLTPRGRRPPRGSVAATGAVVLGGDYRALGVVRSLGRNRLPAWVVRPREDHRLAATSRYCRRQFVVPAEPHESRLRALIRLSEMFGLRDWALIPSADATALFVARHHAELADHYRLTTPPWSIFRWGYDKRLTAELADAAGVDQPRSSPVPDRRTLLRYRGPFPVILKPSTKPSLNGPSTKAWRADDMPALLERFDQASAVTPPGTLLLQELIPAGRGAHLSYAALCRDGEPLVSICAERLRQYPMDFGQSSTFVQSIDDADVAERGGRVLRWLRLTGLAEVEFIRDRRTGTLHLLDINLRVWGWHTIGRRHGLDFPYLLWRQATGQTVTPVTAPAGLRWLRLTTDAPAALSVLGQDGLSLGCYLRSLAPPHESACFAVDDPLPGMLELPQYALARTAVALRRRSAP